MVAASTITAPAAPARRDLATATLKKGTIAPFIESGQKTFQCPDGIQTDRTSPDYGRPFQVSYGFNFVVNGPGGITLVEITDGNGASNVMLVWDHTTTPACCQYGNPRIPVTPFVDPRSACYPVRHNNNYNVLFCDGHVVTMPQSDLTEAPFYPR